jgi:dehydrogenase/reductase SDR family protein 12
MVNTREFVEGNIEVNFATNTLGTYILTKSLIPVVSKAEKPRIVSFQKLII